MRKPRRYKHQDATYRKYRRGPLLFDMSDPGTGKTRPALEAWYNRKNRGRLLVVAVLSNVESVWVDEAARWIPGVEVATALAPYRTPAFRSGAEVVVINTDGVKWIADNRPGTLLRDFDTLVVDESAHFKHPNSGRSKALLKISTYFEYKALLSGTPHANSVLDLWHQMMVLDGGKRLGNDFYRFRYIMAEQVRVGTAAKAIKWVDRPGAVEACWSATKDISIRHEFEKCVDIPEHSQRTLWHNLPPEAMAQYEILRTKALLLLEKGEIVGVQKAALIAKLLQVCSGAVYDQDSKYHLIDPGRYQLVADLVQARKHSIVFFNWRHQREELMKELQRREIKADFIDGTVSTPKRKTLVDQYQAGKLRTLLLHPRAAAHGLTLTRGTYSIWCSPIYEPDKFRQGNARIYRATQTKKTECIMIQARGTCEAGAYQRLRSKDAHMMEFLDLIATE